MIIGFTIESFKLIKGGKMKNIYYICAVLIMGYIMSGCTSRSLKIEPLDTKIHQIDVICIEENKKVFDKTFLPAIISAFKHHHIKSKVYSEVPISCFYKLKYTAKSNWDMAMYLQSASIELYNQENTVIASVLYRSPDALNLSKFKSTESKVYPVIDKLLLGHISPSKEQIKARKKNRKYNKEEKSFENKMDRIKKLHGKGILTDEEYSKKRQSLINSI